MFADGQLVGWGSNQLNQVLRNPPTVVGFRAVAAGYSHNIAVRNDGTALCWGANSSGQSTVPTGLSGVVGASAGGNHTVALRNDGTVTCWGLNTAGQCTVPVGLAGVTQVASGYAHNVALKSDGLVTCWGDNGSTQCTVPAGLVGVANVGAGLNHSLAVRTDGTVAAWGSNSNGECNVPASANRVKQIAGGDHTIALTRNNTVLCWGSNASGQCNAPANLDNVARVAAGRFHSVALKIDGSVVCWGSPSFGQCNVPPGLSGVAGVAGGGNHTSVVLLDGSIRCWGHNDSGQSIAPTANPEVAQVACGNSHTVAANADGTVSCWGSNGSGQCSVPANMYGVVGVAAGYGHTVVCTNAGYVYAWGRYDQGQSNVPFGLSGVVQVAAGWHHSIARRGDGTVSCWGAGGQGQCTPPTTLGTVSNVACGAMHTLGCQTNGLVKAWGSNANGQTSVPTIGVTGIVQVAGGYGHSLALRSTGVVIGWGGVGVDYGQVTPPAGLVATQIAAGDYHSVALRTDGTVACWGWNSGGMCTPPTGLAGVTQVAAGAWHTMALLSPALSGCANSGGLGSATIAISGSTWQSVDVWNWSGAGPQVPGALSNVDLGTYGSVASECSAAAQGFVSRPGASLLMTAEALQWGNDYSVRVGTEATLAGRVWVRGILGGGSALPEDLDVPVLSAQTITGTFDLIQTEVPPPAGYFLTLVPSSVNGRTLLSLKLLPLPGNAELSGANTGTFSGTAVAAETIDIDHDGFDDLALAVDFGAGQNGLIQILLNDGAGNLGGSSVLCSIPPQPTCLAVGDVNGDGRRDVAVGIASDQSARVYLDNGQGALTAGTVMSAVGGTPRAVIVIPPSGASIMPTSSSVGVGIDGSKLKIYENGTLQQELTMAGTVETVKGGDTGGRSGTDIVTGGTKSANFTVLPVAETGFVQVLRRQANGLYGIVQSMYLTAKPKAMDVADLDGDGLADIVTANADPELPAPGSALPVLAIFRNTNGMFGGAVPYQPAGASGGLGVSLIDADNDGDRDIVGVYRKIGTDSEAALLRVDTLGAGTPISIGQTTVLDAADPTLSARGNLDGIGGDDLYLVDNGGGSFLTGTKTVKPYVATGGRVGDLDLDGVIGSSDVALLLLDFGRCAGCPSDLDGNSWVDNGDLALLLLMFD